MKTLFLSLVLVLLVSCGKQDPSEMKTMLSGYWEIEKVQLSDGSERTFGINTIIDYIEIYGDSGVRKKVFPKFDGSFTVNNSAEKFDIKIENDSLNLYYQTPFDSWKETVLEVRDSMLQVLNKDGKVYTYKKFRTFKLDDGD